MEIGYNQFWFPVVDNKFKDQKATYSYSSENFYLKAMKLLKRISSFHPSDVAMDPYSTDGHDGLVINEINNEESIPILCKMALSQANAGIDIETLRHDGWKSWCNKRCSW